MSTLTSRRSIEASGTTGGNASEAETVCEVQAGSSTLPQLGAQEDSPSSSGEHSTSGLF